jgi:CheY-like chemotaxis protein
MMSDKPEQTRSDKPAEPATILVVDDSDDFRDLLRKILRHQGYEVLFAGNGETALRLCHLHRGVIHLVVTDVVMPGMSGPELAARLLTLRPNIKVLFISAFVQETALQIQSKLRPVDGFLAKPFPPERLITKVQEMLAA